MHLKSCLNVSLLVLFATMCDSYQIGKGKFESFNGNRYTDAKSMSDNDTKTFFSLNRNRPPAHDTPASPCSCSKLPWRIIGPTSEKRIPATTKVINANRSYFFFLHHRLIRGLDRESFFSSLRSESDEVVETATLNIQMRDINRSRN